MNANNKKRRKRHSKWQRLVHHLCIERAQYGCEVCGNWDKYKKGTHINGFGLVAHHLREFADGGGDVAENVLILCSDCHDKIHKQGKYGIKIT